MVATSPRVSGGGSHDTIVYVPSTVPGHVAVTGAAVIAAVTKAPDGSRFVYVDPTGTQRCGQLCRQPSGVGRYTVMVGPDGTSVASVTLRLADHPLAPISEPQANGDRPPPSFHG